MQAPTWIYEHLHMEKSGDGKKSEKAFTCAAITRSIPQPQNYIFNQDLNILRELMKYESATWRYLVRPFPTENSSVCREQTEFFLFPFSKCVWKNLVDFNFIIVWTQEYKVSAFLFSLAATAVNTTTEVNVSHMHSHRSFVTNLELSFLHLHKEESSHFCESKALRALCFSDWMHRWMGIKCRGEFVLISESL